MSQQDLKVLVKSKDIDPELQNFIIGLVKNAFKKHSWQEMASYFQEELNLKSAGNWHCFVGRNFGSYVTYQAKHYIYFYVGQIAFMFFKTFKN